MKRNLTREAVRNCVDSTQIFELDYLECKKFPICKKKKLSTSAELFCWCGKQDWILAARRRSVSAVLKPHWGLIHYGFFKSVSRFAKKETQCFHRVSFMVRETGLDSRGSSPLGQRRSQAPPGLDSLRLLQVRFPVYKKRSSALLPSFFLWCSR